MDEIASHDRGPSLTHPVTLVPFGFMEYQRATTVGITDPKGLYAGAGEIGYGPIVPEEVWPHVQAYSASRDRLRASDGVYKSVLSPALTEHLSGFLLAMTLGT